MGDTVIGGQVKKEAGGDITEGVKFEAGRDIGVEGSVAGATVSSRSTRRTSRQIAALGFLILCIAAGVAFLLTLIGMFVQAIDKETGLRLITILLGVSGLSGLLKVILRK